MTFNSLAYLLLHSFCFVAYFLLPHRARWILLLGASYYFYMYWRPEYILIMVVSTAIDFAAAHLMQRWPGEAGQRKRRVTLAVSLGANLLILFTFKYFAFAARTVEASLGWLSMEWKAPTLDLLLPMGISFYTFQSMSYTIDVYRGHCTPERHFGRFALYVAFYPQLVAGPIERPSHLLPQLQQGRKFDQLGARQGARRILWGLFKKTVIADRLAAIVAPAYIDPVTHAGFPLWVATYAFALQIYVDFSAYSDIAIGSARMLGIDLMENFRRPYFAQSIGEFWQRWHISLSTWFRDYLYIPLGGNRVGRWRWGSNVMVVFLVSGLWHGASWAFVLWGFLHGAFLLIGAVSRGMRDQLARTAGVPHGVRVAAARLVCFHLVCAAWVFFRAGSASKGLTILAHAGAGWNVPSLLQVLPSGTEAFILLSSLVVLGAVDVAEERGGSISARASHWPLPVRWLAYASLALTIINFAVVEQTPFIYFQF
jgi:alginate O-acetyltransferase complex protein AlgI